MMDNLSSTSFLDFHLFHDVSLQITSLIKKFYEDTRVEAWNYGRSIFFLSSICFIFELIRPVNHCTLLSRMRGTCFLLIYILIVSAFYSIFQHFWSSLGLTPLLVIKFNWLSDLKYFPFNMLNGIVATILALMISDFFYYWFHRLQHANKFLWRFHSVHHSVKELSVWNSYHHFTEEIFRVPFFLLPVTLFSHVDGGYVPIVFALLIMIQGPFAHSSTRVNFGIFRYIILDNKYHRIHHSIEPEHLNKNFSGIIPIWDIIFKTSHFPYSREWPSTGLADIEEPKYISDFLWRPFNRKFYT